MNNLNTILVAAVAVCAIGASAEELTLNVAEPGTLSTLIDSRKYTTTKLTLTGTINGLDWQTIREMAGCDYYWNTTPGVLEDLDISAVTIVGGAPVVQALGSDPSNPVIIPARDNALSEELFTQTRIRHIVMPESITAIYSAFSGASELEGTVTVPEGVEILGEYAFEGCCKVEAFVLPSTLHDTGDPSMLNQSAIGAHAFADCTSLTEFTLPAGVTRIKQETFANCRFPTITIPASVDRIDYCAFYGCTNLTDVTVERKEPAKLYYDAFHGVDVSNVVLHVPAGSVEAYKTADEWCYFGTITDEAMSGVAVTTAKATADREEWHTITGVRLNEKPDAPGVYIVNGRKEVVR